MNDIINVLNLFSERTMKEVRRNESVNVLMVTIFTPFSR